MKSSLADTNKINNSMKGIFFPGRGDMIEWYDSFKNPPVYGMTTLGLNPNLDMAMDN